MRSEVGRLACPACGRYGVERLYLASARLDACACAACGNRWDERPPPRRSRWRGAATTEHR